MKLKDKLLIYYKLLIYNIGQGRMPPKKKPAALSAKQEEEELSEMVTITITTIIDHHDHHHIKFKTIISPQKYFNSPPLLDKKIMIK